MLQMFDNDLVVLLATNQMGIAGCHINVVWKYGLTTFCYFNRARRQACQLLRKKCHERLGEMLGDKYRAFERRVQIANDFVNRRNSAGRRTDRNTSRSDDLLFIDADFCHSACIAAITCRAPQTNDLVDQYFRKATGKSRPTGLCKRVARAA